MTKLLRIAKKPTESQIRYYYFSLSEAADMLRITEFELIDMIKNDKLDAALMISPTEVRRIRESR